MEIPIKISVRDNTREVAENLFGLGDKITDPETIKYLGNDARYVNKTTPISDGITLGHRIAGSLQASVESIQPDQWFDWNVALFIADKLLNIGGNGFVIADWLWNRLKSTQFKIELNGKEITTKGEFQKTLDEYIESHSDK
ncbi:MAG: hypothetical protein KGL95_10220 [Patescibacteria group bacterium]|nr:hypothetical protein [Patescibacteria group bacterium]